MKLKGEGRLLPRDALAVYVHSPFCPSKCGYCDFNSYAMTGEVIERTCRATIRQILDSPSRGRPARTVFFGGGTPTFVPVELLVEMLEAVFEVHPPVEGAEITSEANPGTVDAKKFAAMREGGFNRISLGAQSFLDDDLVRLGRVHRHGEIERAVAAARSAGFENVNLDLMFALPGQTLRGWRDNLDRALAMGTEHLSLYCLTLEPNTAFYKEHLRGTLILPEDDVQTEMYDLAVERTGEAGMACYEISNFARPGRECAHNLAYWRCEEYAAYGPGAVGCLADEPGSPWHAPRTRFTHLKHPERFCAAIESGQTTVFESESLDAEALRLERVMLGLRLTEGLDPDGLDLDPRAVAGVESLGWLARGERLRLTPEGRHFCSEVALRLVSGVAASSAPACP